MKAFIVRHPIAAVAIALAVGAALIGAVWLVGAVARPDQVTAPSTEPTPTPSATPSESAKPSAVAGCPQADVTVDSADALQSALDAALPGTVIVLAPGQYVGNFVAGVSGDPGSLITLCGSKDSVLDGGDPSDGYVFHLDGAQYWHLLGFSVTNGQKGVMADGTAGSIIEGLTVSHIGDEAIHLRKNSVDSQVIGNDISDTGLRKQKFGEGVYIGSAESNWCDITDCNPDNSDRNQVIGNTIHGTTSESIDIKEGTSHGVVRGNHFDGSTIVAADSWVDVKGRDWLIEGNTGENSPGDGFQTHEIGDGGWGTRNVFRGNTANVNGPGFGYSLTPVRDNVVTCDNKASNAGEGFSNVTCTG